MTDKTRIRKIYFSEDLRKDAVRSSPLQLYAVFAQNLRILSSPIRHLWAIYVFRKKN